MLFKLNLKTCAFFSFRLLTLKKNFVALAQTYYFEYYFLRDTL